MSRRIPPRYRTRNWPAYNKALKQRGSLAIWFDPDMVWVPPPTGKPGRQPQYSDAAIQTCLTMKVLFGLALRTPPPKAVCHDLTFGFKCMPYVMRYSHFTN